MNLDAKATDRRSGSPTPCGHRQSMGFPNLMFAIQRAASTTGTAL